MNIELDITQKEFERLSILARRQGLTVGQYLIKNLDTNLVRITQHQYEMNSLLLFLTRNEDFENIEDLEYFLGCVDDVEELKRDLIEYQEVLDDIINTSDDKYKLLHKNMDKQYDIDNRLDEIESIKNDIVKAQKEVDEYIEAYRTQNPNFDVDNLDNEVKECRTWLTQIKETK